jgi:hypothetical protein
MKQDLTEDQIERIEAKIEWEGLDEYFSGGWADDDFEGTVLAPLLRAYNDARDELIATLSDLGVDV